MVYRGLRLADGLPVVLKVLKNEFPTPQETARYAREFRIAGPLQLAHAVRVLALVRQGHRSVLVYADDGCVSLRRLYGGRALAVEAFLRVAIAATEALAEVHAQQLIHCDVNPANLLIHPTSGAVKLTDFELARSVDAEIEGATRAMGTLAYMAPEQSGRSNLRADQRADLYSLGASLFELAAGRQVFVDLDDVSLLHAHFALSPPSLRELLGEFPALLDAIVLKLLAKMPSERYQTARGLLADLRACQQRLQRGEPLEGLQLGQSDHSLALIHMDRMIGRDTSLAQLDAALATAQSAPRPLWLRLQGAAGSGKSTLMARFAERLPANNLVLTGRCEAASQGSPYASLKAAFDGLMQHWLALTADDLASLRGALCTALGVNLGVLLPLLPQLPAIVGTPSRPLPLGASAEQARFQLALRNFWQLAAARQRPLILFIDDVQWADSATLQALETLLASDLPSCLVVTAEREEGTPDAYSQMVERLSVSGLPTQLESLPPLRLEQVVELLAGSVGAIEGGSAAIESLAEVIHARTLGNPFFIRQLLANLVRDGLLMPVSADQGVCWRFDTNRASGLAMADNLLDLLSERIESLPAAMRSVLEHAACIGHTFDLATLRSILPPALAVELPTLLDRLHDVGMVQRSADEQTLRFIHERVRDAALALIGADPRARIHLAIGRLWQQQTLRSTFEKVAQLNRSMGLIHDDQERLALALLNADAARLSRTQTAYEASLEYAGYALSLLPSNSALVAVGVARDLHVLLADAQASAGHLDAAIEVFEHALALATSSEDQALVQERMCDALQSSGQPAAALQQVQRALDLLGQPLPLPAADNEAYADLLAEQDRLFARLSDASVLLTLTTLPAANEAAARISRLYDKAIIGVYFSRPEMLGFVTARSVNHVLQTGLTPEAALAFAWWSMMLCMQDKHALATEYAQWVRTIHARFGNDYYGGGGRMVATAMTLCWTRPYAECFAEAGESARLLHQSGNMQFSSYGLITQHIITVAEAADCQAMLSSCDVWADYCARYVPLELGQAQIRRYCIARLMGLDPPALDCEAIVAAYAEQNNATDVCESLTEMARFALLRDDFAAALSLCERAHPYFSAGAAGNLLLNFNHWVMLAISSARRAGHAKDEERQRLQTQFADAAARVTHLSTLQWQNFAAYGELVRAEGALMRGEHEAAMGAYFASIRHSQQHGYALLQAQATQYLAELLREQGHHFAYSVQRDAEQLYQRAGCLIKVYDRASLSTTSTATTDVRTTRASRSSDVSRGVDVLSLMKANEAITSEMDYDRLLLRLLEITVENAGAQRGVLVLREDDDFFVVAASEVGRLHQRLGDTQHCPLQMIHYVARSGQVTVLESGPRRSAFREEPYFEANAVRSVLAAPLLRQGTVRGVMYLENNAVDGAFGHDRLEAIRLLLGAAAIALENASLYSAQKKYADELETRVKARTLELESANASLARLADLDGLTQIANRRSFDRCCERFAEERAAVTMLLCDVDDFKAYNDHYGHPAGDEVLRRVAATLAAAAPPSAGLVARYGGEEFAIVLRDAEPNDAEAFAHRVQAAVGALQIPHQFARAAKAVTLSVGVSRVAALSATRIGTLIADADKALYVAKQNGRNQVSLHADFHRATGF